MRRYTFGIVLEQMLAKKKVIIAFLAIMVLLCGVYGVLKSKGALRDADTVKADEEYNEQITNYENAIAEVTTALEKAQEAVDNQKEYVDHSIFMKLDSQKVYVAALQYAMAPATTTNEAGETVTANTNIGNVLQSYVLYVNDGAFRKDALGYFNQTNTQTYDYEIKEEYLKELVVVSVAGNAVNVLMQCPDENFAAQMLPAMQKALDGRKSTIEEVQGKFDVQMLSSEVYTKADTNVLNTQNSQLNNMKNYENALADCLTKQNGTKDSRDKYIDKSDAETSTSKNPVKEMIKWVIYGVILGIGIPFAVMTLIYMTSDKVKAADELMAAGLEVVKAEEVQSAVQRLYLLSKKKGVNSLYIWSVSESEKLAVIKAEVEKEVSSALGTAFEIKLISGTTPKLQDMSEMVENGNVMLAIAIGKDTYTQLDQLLEQLSSLGTDCWGCVVL